MLIVASRLALHTVGRLKAIGTAWLPIAEHVLIAAGTLQRNSIQRPFGGGQEFARQFLADDPIRQHRWFVQQLFLIGGLIDAFDETRPFDALETVLKLGLASQTR